LGFGHSREQESQLEMNIKTYPSLIEWYHVKVRYRGGAPLLLESVEQLNRNEHLQVCRVVHSQVGCL
jgi:hypothetical protein